MNLFLAILLSNFEPKEDENGNVEEEEDDEDSENEGLTRKEKFKLFCIKTCGCCFKKKSEVNIDVDELSIKAEMKDVIGDSNNNSAMDSEEKEIDVNGQSQNNLLPAPQAIEKSD
jgi:hypothetical protein